MTVTEQLSSFIHETIEKYSAETATITIMIELHEIVSTQLKKEWNAAIEKAAESAKIKYDHFDDMAAYIDEQSILKLKKP